MIKLINYFEEISDQNNIDEVSENSINKKIIDSIENKFPMVLSIIKKINSKMEEKNQLKINLNRLINHFKNIFFQKLNPVIETFDEKEKSEMSSHKRKFYQVLSFLESMNNFFLNDNKQNLLQNKQIIIQIFFCSFLLYKIIILIEKKINEKKENEEEQILKNIINQGFFEKSYKILFSIIKQGSIYRKNIDENLNDEIIDDLKLLKDLNKFPFYKEIKIFNKKEKEIKANNKVKKDRFYLNYVGKEESKMNFKYKVYQEDLSGNFPKNKFTPKIYDLIVLSEDGQFAILDLAMSLKDLLNKMKSNEVILENFSRMFVILNQNDLNKSTGILLRNTIKLNYDLKKEETLVLTKISNFSQTSKLGILKFEKK